MKELVTAWGRMDSIPFRSFKATGHEPQNLLHKEVPIPFIQGLLMGVSSITLSGLLLQEEEAGFLWYPGVAFPRKLLVSDFISI